MKKNGIAKQLLYGKGSKTNTFNLRDFFKKFSKKNRIHWKKGLSCAWPGILVVF